MQWSILQNYHPTKHLQNSLLKVENVRNCSHLFWFLISKYEMLCVRSFIIRIIMVTLNYCS